MGSQRAGGSQGAVHSGMVTRAGLASSTESRQSNVGSEQNAGSRSPAEACDLIMQVAVNMETPVILSVLCKPPVPKYGSVSAPGHKVADAGQSQAQAEQSPGGWPMQVKALVDLRGSWEVTQDRLDIRESTLSDTPVVQVDGPQGGPHQADGAQGGPSLHPGHPGLPGVRQSGKQRSQSSPYQAGLSGMEGGSDKFS